MRDQIKDENYFNIFIQESEDRIKLLSEKLNNGEIAADREEFIKSLINYTQIDKIKARYSRGDALEPIRTEFMGVLEAWEKIYEQDTYDKTLQIVSLMVLLRVPEEMFSKVSIMYNNSDKYSDWLLEYLLTNRKDDRTALKSELWDTKSFAELKSMIEENRVSSSSIKKYLSRWYSHGRSCGWYDSHKSKANAYAGYWSFEAGAIAKIFGIDDESIKDHKYYPYDLVHF